ncbi:MAG: DUF805 domain-containing protein [Galactobacter sp.]
MSTPPNPPDSTPPGWNNPNDSGEGAPSYGQSQQEPAYGQGPSYGNGYGQSNQNSYQQPQNPGGYQQGYPTPPQYQGPTTGYIPPRPRGAASEEDLTLPLYGASLMQSIKRFYKKYTTFSGRASRSEYWWVVLYQGVVGLILGGAAGALLGVSIYNGLEGVEGSQQLYTDGNYYYDDYTWNPGPLFTVAIVVAIIAGLWYLANLVPNIAITWRRLHDANLAGPFYFLSLTSVGAIVVLVMTILDSKVEGERFDAVPAGQYPPGGYGQPDQFQQPGSGYGQSGQQSGYGQPNQYGQQPPQPPQY